MTIFVNRFKTFPFYVKPYAEFWLHTLKGNLSCSFYRFLPLLLCGVVKIHKIFYMRREITQSPFGIADSIGDFQVGYWKVTSPSVSNMLEAGERLYIELAS